MEERAHPDDVLFEFRRIGGSLRVAAIDPVRNVEVIIMAPAHSNEGTLKQIALRKLAYVLGNRISPPAGSHYLEKV